MADSRIGEEKYKVNLKYLVLESKEALKEWTVQVKRVHLKG